MSGTPTDFRPSAALSAWPCNNVLSNLNEFIEQAALTVPCGQRLVYDYPLHSSVGFDARYQIADPQVVGFVEQTADYHSLKRLIPGITGADKATGHFVFEALQPGSTTLTLEHLYRFEVEKTVTITITVVAA